MKPSLRTRKAAVLLWGAVSAALAVTFAAFAVHDAVDRDPAVAWHLINMGLTIFNLLSAATVWDRFTDTEVLRRLRQARTPSSAANLARHLGRRPGPVGLSLLRLVRQGQVVQADTVNGVPRFRVR
ncbi:hypothetical protein [Kitasatospora phosalacinea]|uniref:Uncharacterized protein n=1 Tax=Kitasatospora phosalacinea TaxID=2065 RepID=A0A9W6PKW7_9ACTN|nr:hypothetical protein [Kitasatospora phosalacinea]GLW58209.1 hypothetical protein Kpho01_62200 [Kitasatospora phosalacinea]